MGDERRGKKSAPPPLPCLALGLNRAGAAVRMPVMAARWAGSMWCDMVCRKQGAAGTACSGGGRERGAGQAQACLCRANARRGGG